MKAARISDLTARGAPTAAGAAMVLIEGLPAARVTPCCQDFDGELVLGNLLRTPRAQDERTRFLR